MSNIRSSPLERRLERDGGLVAGGVCRHRTDASSGISSFASWRPQSRARSAPPGRTQREGGRSSWRRCRRRQRRQAGSACDAHLWRCRQPWWPCGARGGCWGRGVAATAKAWALDGVRACVGARRKCFCQPERVRGLEHIRPTERGGLASQAVSRPSSAEGGRHGRRDRMVCWGQLCSESAVSTLLLRSCSAGCE